MVYKIANRVYAAFGHCRPAGWPLGRNNIHVEARDRARTAVRGVCAYSMAIVAEIHEDATLQDIAGAYLGESTLHERVGFDAKGEPVSIAGDNEGWILDDSDGDDDMAEEDEMDANELYQQIQEDKLSESLESSLDMLIWSMPFVFVFELLNVLIRQQYAMEISLATEIKTLISRMPSTYDRSLRRD